MNTILAIDSATGPCSVALWKDGHIAAYLENRKPAAQSAVLMPMIEEALKQAGVRYHDLSHVAATIGPGSFTGIRVGLAAARGIAFAAGIKSMGFTTLEVMAFAHTFYSSPRRGEARRGAEAVQHNDTANQASPHPNLPPMGEGTVLAMINAGKGEYYYQLFEAAPQFQPLSEPKLGTLQEIMQSAQPETSITSNVSDICHPSSGICREAAFPRADVLAELAATLKAAARPLTPFYIRQPDAKLPVKKP